MNKLVIVLTAFLVTIGCIGQKINGVNIVSSKKSFDGVISEKLTAINANYIALTPYLLMKENRPEIYYEIEGNYWGDYRINLKKLVEDAQQSGLKTMLKPHIFVENIGWAGTLNFNTKDWYTWKVNFAKKMLIFAQFAEENKIDILCIGVELKSATQKDSLFFIELIKRIRKIYKGKLTYAANWDNYQNITFWKELDYIGIDGYFPISLKKSPSKQDLMKGWDKITPKLKRFSATQGKSIIFTEFGYRSCDFSLGKQWEIESNKKIPTNYNNQTNGYEVFFEKVYQLDCVAGGFIWKWYGNDVDLRDLPKNSYTPQGKPAEKLIQQWYSK
ncbi:MAG: hypothetical protein N4A35_10760 [Flavobacteriales bacterium]|jgi:hypothetical protein|nr:hypothetical protein [Flavobacteriales bacterium]